MLLRLSETHDALEQAAELSKGIDATTGVDALCKHLTHIDRTEQEQSHSWSTLLQHSSCGEQAQLDLHDNRGQYVAKLQNRRFALDAQQQAFHK